MSESQEYSPKTRPTMKNSYFHCVMYGFALDMVGFSAIITISAYLKHYNNFKGILSRNLSSFGSNVFCLHVAIDDPSASRTSTIIVRFSHNWHISASQITCFIVGM